MSEMFDLFSEVYKQQRTVGMQVQGQGVRWKQQRLSL